VSSNGEHVKDSSAVVSYDYFSPSKPSKIVNNDVKHGALDLVEEING